jgi:hypothetical protein
MLSSISHAQANSVYSKTINAAISGYNNKKLSNVSVGECKTACDAESGFVCTSFDYHKNANKCDLSSESENPKTLKPNAGKYDHYSRYIFKKTTNAAISGHNNLSLSNVSVGQCKLACVQETSFTCASFDYAKKTNKCDLSDKSARDVGGLKMNYPDNPYDHYALSSVKTGQASHTTAAAPKQIAEASLTLDTLPKKSPQNALRWNKNGCLDVDESSRAGRGHDVNAFYNCNRNSSNQVWTFYDTFAYIISKSGNIMCLSAARYLGAEVEAQPCETADLKQEFFQYSDGSIRNGYGHCLAIVGKSGRVKNIAMSACSGRDNQIWGYPEMADRNVSYVAMHGSYTCNTDFYNNRSNGCSVPKKLGKDGQYNIDWFYDDDNYKKFKSACNTHDICYSAPWKLNDKSGGKRHCDAEFKRDLMARCDQVHDDGSPNWLICKATAESMYGAVRDQAGKAYKGSQVWAASNCSKQ